MGLLLSACSTPPKQIPKWDGSWWSASSQDGAILLEQDVPDPDHPGQKKTVRQVIKASDPAFDNFSCTPYDQMQSFVQTYVFGCIQWKAP